MIALTSASLVIRVTSSELEAHRYFAIEDSTAFLVNYLISCKELSAETVSRSTGL